MDMKLEPDYFTRNIEFIVYDLIGRTLCAAQPDDAVLKGVITQVAGYKQPTDSMSKGAAYAAGHLSISQKFGSCMIDIATGREGEYACVTIRGIEMDFAGTKERIDGPGKVTRALNITAADRERLDGLPIHNPYLWIQGRTLPGQRTALPINAKNCVAIYSLPTL